MHLKQWHTLAEEHDQTSTLMNQTYRLSRIGVDVGPLSLMQGSCLNKLKNGGQPTNACKVCVKSRSYTQ